MADKEKFNIGDKIIYPTHGLGEVIEITKQVFGSQEIDFLVLSFEKDRMTIRIPISKVETSGLRKISTEKDLEEVISTIKETPKLKRMMWSRRAAEYDEKIRSGNVVSLAEVVRDLNKKANSENQSYSEARIYEEALERLADEYAAVHGIPSDEAEEKLEKIMAKSSKKSGEKDMSREDEALRKEIEALADEIDDLDI